MIKKITVCQGVGTDPDHNLAVEEYLLFHVEPEECILYLWQNENTVVIGRNQNSWKECKVSELLEEGGHLARRLSGGGAVYHDLGNLNFTFLTRKEDYDLKTQLQVIEKSVEAFGIPVKYSGRNDLLAEGRKFSGNAFYESQGFAYHHGTILVDVDTEKMGRYLTVSKEKLQSKGVDSVKSRVGNLKDLSPKITVEAMKRQMRLAFEEVYGKEAKEKTLSSEAVGEIEVIAEKYRSFEWKYGRKIPFTHRFSRRFSWGEVEIQFKVNQGLIEEVKQYSDALTVPLPELEDLLLGCPYERGEVERRLREGENGPDEDASRELLEFLISAI